MDLRGAMLGISLRRLMLVDLVSSAGVEDNPAPRVADPCTAISVQ
jgi:hypothetical protein